MHIESGYDQDLEKSESQSRTKSIDLGGSFRCVIIPHLLLQASSLKESRMSTSTDLNLLFGILALQLNFVSRDQLVTAMNAWVIEKDSPIGSLFVRHGAMTEEQRKLLDALVEAHLQKHQGEIKTCLELLSSIDQDAAHSLALIEDSGLHESLKRIHVLTQQDANPFQADALATVTGNPNTEVRTTRFQVLRPHRRGGLGEVFVARDTELSRVVALKEIQARHAHNQDSRTRFIREAEITGRLEHPGIVPVYGLGTYDNGLPFYAMRFIRGDSLLDAIERFHSNAQSPSNEEQNGRLVISYRDLLGRFIDVCHAIHYAHSRGVLHRDLKPGNIMLGEYGETLVVDWGLAKVFSTDETDLDPDSGTPPMSTIGTDSAPTMLGSTIGTPAYMSPEQAAGALDKLGPATDVYSLGATLYHLIVGSPPFDIQDGDVGKLLRDVQEGRFQRPRARNSKISPALEAICLKAMSVSQQLRYATPLLFAQDVSRFLADESVLAYPEPLKTRASRWLRKHPATTAVAVATLMLGLISSFVFTWLIGQHANQLHAKSVEVFNKNEALLATNAELENARDQAKLEAEKSSQLSTFMLSMFQAADPVRQGKGVFMGKPSDSNLTARDLLDRGAARLKADQTLIDKPLVRAEIAGTIGDVYRQLSLFEESKILLDESLALRQSLLPANHPDIATSHHDLGAMYHEQGDYERGEHHYRQALEIRRALDGETGQKLVANTLFNLGWLKGNEDKYEEAVLLLEEAASIREKVLGKSDRDYAFCHVGMAICRIQQGKYAEAIPKLVWAGNILASAGDNQNITNALVMFAKALTMRQTFGDKIAEPSFREVCTLVEKELGARSIYYGLARFELATSLLKLDRRKEALEIFEECLQIARNAVQLKHPRVILLVATYADELLSDKRMEEGEKIWQEFISAMKSRFGEHGFSYWRAIAEHGLFLRHCNKKEAALQAFDDAIAAFRKIDPKRDFMLALLYGHKAALLCDDRHDYAAARPIAEEGIALFDEQPASKTGVPIAWAYINARLARIYCEEGDSRFEDQLDLSKRLMNKLNVSDRLSGQELVLQIQSDALAKNSNFASALETCKERKRLHRRDPSILEDIMLDLLKYADSIRSDEPSELSIKENLIRESVQTLTQAIQSGWKRWNTLKKNVYFRLLADREDFKQLQAAHSPTK